jgi:hypothetical protein
MKISGHMPLIDALNLCSQKWDVDVESAWKKLLPLLHDEEIRSLIIMPDQTTHRDPDLWIHPANADAYKHGKLHFQTSPISRTMLPAYISERHLNQFLNTNEPSTAVTKLSKKRPNGRPLNSGHDAFWIEICRLIHKGECWPGKDTQEQFVTHLKKWCDDNMENPYSPDTILDKIKAMWKVVVRKV